MRREIVGVCVQKHRTFGSSHVLSDHHMADAKSATRHSQL